MSGSAHSQLSQPPLQSSQESKLRILVVDDDETNRAILEVFLAGEGYVVILACDGREAASLYEREKPDIVMMDVMMPVMDGYEAAREIKRMAGEHYVPIIFLTALTEELALAKCVEAGGDDFMSKPLSRIVLKAKIRAAERNLLLYKEVVLQQRELIEHHQRLQIEHELAERLFKRLLGANEYSAKNIKSHQSALSVTNGDLVLIAEKPSGGQRVMLADSCGHGLSAAIGAMPVADIFYTMTRKGLSISELVHVLNKKLHMTLPTGQYVAGCIIDSHRTERKISIWNGGMPDVLCISATDKNVTRIPSRNLALGILAEDDVTVEIRSMDFNHGDAVYAYSDGLVDLENKDGLQLGKDKLASIITNSCESPDPFDVICQTIVNYGEGVEQQDDITIVELSCCQDAWEESGEGKGTPISTVNRTWSLRLSNAELITFDPLVAVKGITNGIPGLEESSTTIFTIFQELYSNALEHGVLGLSSALKEGEEGFNKYYEERARRLREAKDGWIHIEVECIGTVDSGELVIQIADSGKGFETGQQSLNDKSPALAGRGITILGSLCRELKYGRRGNHARAVYEWRAQAKSHSINSK